MHIFLFYLYIEIDLDWVQVILAQKYLYYISIEDKN